jgi:hypothetical protein
MSTYITSGHGICGPKVIRKEMGPIHPLSLLLHASWGDVIRDTLAKEKKE